MLEIFSFIGNERMNNIRKTIEENRHEENEYSNAIISTDQNTMDHTLTKKVPPVTSDRNEHSYFSNVIAQGSVEEHIVLPSDLVIEKEASAAEYSSITILNNDSANHINSKFVDGNVAITGIHVEKLSQETTNKNSIVNDVFIVEDINDAELSSASALILRSDTNSIDLRNDSRSLTLDLEKNLKTNPVIPKSSLWDNTNGRRRLIRQSTVEGIKDYFDTINRLEQNSISFVAMNRRCSLPLPVDTSFQKDSLEKDPSKEVLVI